MKRREFLEKAGIGSAVLVSPALVNNLATPAVADAQSDSHAHQPLDGPLASATVSFGQWRTDPPLDRFSGAPTPAFNQHQLIPHDVTIKAGGAVNFVISGFHLVVVYGDGTQPGDIDVTKLVLGTQFIDDDKNRIYRGLNPGQQPRDRVEVISFAHRGTYLVICGFLPHFIKDGMFGFVRVVD